MGEAFRRSAVLWPGQCDYGSRLADNEESGEARRSGWSAMATSERSDAPTPVY